MDIDILVREDLVNWGRWLRSQPSLYKKLNYPACPMFRDYQPKWRDYDDESSARATDLAHDPDVATLTDRTVRLLPREEQQVYLYAYFCEFDTKTKAMKKLGVQERLFDKRLSNAIGAYEVLFNLREMLRETG